MHDIIEWGKFDLKGIDMDKAFYIPEFSREMVARACRC